MDEEDDIQEFTIKCQGGEEILVGKQEARVLFHRIDYFRNVFRHGTREADSRLLKKPDWSLDTTKRIVAYLCGKCVEIPVSDVSASLQFIKAAMQALFKPTLYHPVVRGLRQLSVETKQYAHFFRILKNSGNTCFVLKSQLCGVAWDILLECGIAVLPHSPGSFVTFQAQRRDSKVTFRAQRRDSKFSKEEVKRMKMQMDHRQTYDVVTPHDLPIAIRTISAVMHATCRKIAWSRGRHPRTEVVDTESISIMIPIEYPGLSCEKLSIAVTEENIDSVLEFLAGGSEDLFNNTCPQLQCLKQIIKEIEETTGARGSMLIPKNSTREFPTFHGTINALKHGLDSFLEKLSALDDDRTKVIIPTTGTISLRVTAPTSDTMKRLVWALFDNASEETMSLETDYFHCSFSVRRGVDEMIQVLRRMSEFQSSSDKAVLPDSFILAEKQKFRQY